jgi:hypothetical protein
MLPFRFSDQAEEQLKENLKLNQLELEWCIHLAEEHDSRPYR